MPLYCEEINNLLVDVAGEDDRVQRQYHPSRSVRHKMVDVLPQEVQQVIVRLKVVQHQLQNKHKIMIFVVSLNETWLLSRQWNLSLSTALANAKFYQKQTDRPKNNFSETSCSMRQHIWSSDWNEYSLLVVNINKFRVFVLRESMNPLIYILYENNIKIPKFNNVD